MKKFTRFYFNYENRKYPAVTHIATPIPIAAEVVKIRLSPSYYHFQ